MFTEVKILSDDEIAAVSHTPGNEDIFDRLKYLTVPNWWHSQTHYCIFEGKRLVAAGSLQQSPEEDIMWMMHVSVEVPNQGYGLATQILERMYEDVEAMGKRLKPSSYSEHGFRTIRSTINRMQERYPDNHVPARDEAVYGMTL